MDWSLFLSDVLARVMGVLGLIASLAWLAGLGAGWPGLGPEALFAGGAAVFCLTMTLLFLVPSIHDRMMRKTAHGILRVPFQVVGLIWCAAVIAGLYLATAALRGALGDVSGLIWPIMAVVTLIVTLVLICPVGLAWHAPCREREAAKSTP